MKIWILSISLGPSTVTQQRSSDQGQSTGIITLYVSHRIYIIVVIDDTVLWEWENRWMLTAIIIHVQILIFMG